MRAPDSSRKKIILFQQSRIVKLDAFIGHRGKASSYKSHQQVIKPDHSTIRFCLIYQDLWVLHGCMPTSLNEAKRT